MVVFMVFGHVHKIAKSDYYLCLVHPPICVVHLSCHWTDFHELSYLSTYRKSVEKIQVSLKLDKNNRHFTLDQYTFFIISCSFLHVSDGSCRENQNTHFVFSNFFQTVLFRR